MRRGEPAENSDARRGGDTHRAMPTITSPGVAVMNRPRRSLAPRSPSSIPPSDDLAASPEPAPRVDAAALRTRWVPRILAGVRALGSACLLAGAVIGGTALHRWMVTTPHFAARDVVVTGIDHTLRAEVLSAAGITESRNVLSVDAAVAAHAIQALPWVAEARVHRQLPGSLRIEVREHTPAALLSAAGLYLVDAEGEVFKRAAPGDPTDLPVLTGITREDFARDPEDARERVRDALALLTDLDASAVGPRLVPQEVHAELTGELALLLDGTYVWLGRGPYRAKLTRLRVVLGELHRRGLEASEVHLESERHPERVTVRAHPRRAHASR